MRVLVASGSSGGHIFPAISFIEALKAGNNDAQVLLVLPKKNILKAEGVLPCPVKYITVTPIKLNFSFAGLKSIWQMIKSFFQVILIFINFRPDVAIGFGSLASLPVILLAWFFRTTTVIHEQNVLPGKANKFLAYFSDKIAVSFKETVGYFKGKEKKIVLTGDPIRKSLVRIDKKIACAYLALKEDKFTILVAGGSQGCSRINEEFVKFIGFIPQKNKLQVIHLCGSKDYSRLKESYAGLGIEYKLFDFLQPMEYAYSAADLIISRAGATTIAEIMFFALPAVIIPYPYAYQHQLNNALVLERAGAALIIKDEELSLGQLKRMVLPLIDNQVSLSKMRGAYYGLSIPDAAERLAACV
ncbi:MAG: undecaprenyldiphospho-muramoylpentapeptide beta-N-acetylglucosaminyltransferase [Candidatus Omnitrophica bacterium]|nr:undecaprenyldiphospho-muramoylpentapeptide beta-N-acetylglucosaminyltransferase [Candidatus Omnitrophota bacterium]